MDENQERIRQKGTGSFLIVGILIVIAVVVGAFWLTQNKSTKTIQTTTQVQETITTTPAEEATKTTSEESMVKAIAVEGGNFYFKPNEIRVKKGEKVTITFTSAGGMHNFVLEEFNVASETINSGSTTIEFIPGKTGTFEFYCSIGNHRQMGMKGKLIVE